MPLLPWLSLDEAGGLPRYRQLYFALRDAILDGRLAQGSRLPSSRDLAGDLGIARNSVVAAYEQLTAEGYLEARTGAGSFVADGVAANRRSGPAAPRRHRLSARGRGLAAIGQRRSSRAMPFSPRLPELETFPQALWGRLLARHWRRPPRHALIDGDTAGDPRLRRAIADYLREMRTVRCHPDQVIVLSGAQQAIDLVTRTLVDPGDPVWVEDPGYAGTVGALTAAGARPVPVPVDDEGLSVRQGRARAPAARLACISPSHQFPLGVVMSLRRRLELLDWARSSGGFVLEDDYDSEYRYAGRPLAALQGLDEHERVLYVGTMSKVMFPGLRIGYLVVPEDLVDAFQAVRRLFDGHPSSVAQAALADFIADGHLGSHIRRMRTLYAARQQALLAAVRERLGGLVEIAPDEAGMHLVGYLPEGMDDTKVTAAAANAGIEAPALSRLYHGRIRRSGLLLGYAGVPEPAFAPLVDRLAAAIETVSLQ